MRPPPTIPGNPHSGRIETAQEWLRHAGKAYFLFLKPIAVRLLSKSFKTFGDVNRPMRSDWTWDLNHGISRSWSR